MAVEAHRNREFAAIVNNADLVTPDGMPLAKAVRLLHGVSQDRVAGMDLVPDLISAAEENGLSIFFYGSTQEVLDAVLNRILREHPSLTVAGAYSPPFRPPTSEEARQETARIRDSGAHLILVALGCPKQEVWMSLNKGKFDAAMVGVGGALPVYAQLQQRAPLFLQRLSLEWLYRLYQEPRRLFKRYLVTNTAFLLLLARELVFGQRTK